MDADLVELGAKSSISEDRGVALISDADKRIYSAGISTGGFAEVRMARMNPDKQIIATTIDEEGLVFTKFLIQKLGLRHQIETKLEDLRGDWPYDRDCFDFIYARLVLHYLSAQDLNVVLQHFASSLKFGGRLFAVVRSAKSFENDSSATYDPKTRFTKRVFNNEDGTARDTNERYFHTQETMREHVEKAGFRIESIAEYDERIYRDYARTEAAISPKDDHLLEVVATKAS